MRRIIASFAGLLLCLGSVVQGTNLPRAKDKWIEVTGPSFSYVSQTDERKARKVALAFERFRQVFLWLNPAIDPAQPVPVRVIIFRDDFAFQPYQRTRSKHDLKIFSESYFGDERAYIALSADWRLGDPLPLVYEAYATFMLGNRFRDLPLWYLNGLVDYYGTFRFEGGKSADLGLPDESYIELLQQRSFDHLPSLFEVRRGDPKLRDAHENTIFRARSWILVHFLMSGDESRKQSTATFVAQLMKGADPEAAFHQSFGITTAAMEEILQDYVSARGLPYFPIDLGQVGEPPEFEARRMTHTEVLRELGTYLAYSQSPPAPSALDHLLAATQSDPQDGDAWAARAYATEKSGQIDAATPLFDKAMALDPKQALSHIWCAQHLLSRSEDESAHATARRELERAVELAPDLAQPRILLASHFAGDANPEEGFRLFEEALAVAPARTDLAHNLVILALNHDDLDKAGGYIDIYLSAAGDPQALDRARRAVRTYRDDRETRVHTEIYNHADALVNAGQLEAARDELQSLVQEIQNPRLAQMANDLLAEILQRLGTRE